MQILFRSTSRVWEDGTVIGFRPTQIGIVTGIGIGTISSTTVTVLIEVLTITMPTADGSIGFGTHLGSFLIAIRIGHKIVRWNFQQRILRFVVIEFFDSIPGGITFGSRWIMIIECRIVTLINETIGITSEITLFLL